MESGFSSRARGYVVFALLAVGVLGIAGVLLYPSFTRESSPVTPTPSIAPGAEVQDVYIRALSTGVYDTSSIEVKAGVPVRLHFSAEPDSGCGRAFMMRDFRIQFLSLNGEEHVATFTPPKGSFEYSCTMRMFRGVLIAR